MRHAAPSGPPKVPSGSEGALFFKRASSGVEGIFGSVQTHPPAILTFSVLTPRACRAERNDFGVMSRAFASAWISAADLGPLAKASLR